jgi:hypothetical protein
VTTIGPVAAAPPAASKARTSYRRIDADAVHKTIVALEARIGSHFPESGLRKVAQEFIEVSHSSAKNIRYIRRRSFWVRVLAWLLCVSIFAILATVPFTLRPGKVDTLADAVQVLEAALSSSFFIGACIIFLLTLQSRMRQQRTMESIHELRALAHVVDMHQLTKDPPMLLGVMSRGGLPEIPQSAWGDRSYTTFDLQRYLDYCSEMLALISKVAVLYVQDSADSTTINLVDDIENLTNGLSRKIWQKIMIINSTQNRTQEIKPNG